jgi:hypothetical protein
MMPRAKKVDPAAPGPTPEKLGKDKYIKKISDFTCGICKLAYRARKEREGCFECKPRKEHVGKKMQSTKETGAPFIVNSRGDKVSPDGRPAQGWGSCNFIDHQTSGRCDHERWSGRGTFCHTHMEQVRARKREKQVKELAEQGVVAELEEKIFHLDRAQDAINLLGKIMYHVYKGWLHPMKAAKISSICRIAIKALDSKLIALRLYSIIQGMKQGGMDVGAGLDEIDEMMRDAELGRSLGLRDVVGDLDKATRKLQGPVAIPAGPEHHAPPGAVEPILDEGKPPVVPPK